ncbi:MAG: YdcF family protein [Bacteroidales bacterium]|nr:YdcF family protein [Bacteroidales bacterium]
MQLPKLFKKKECYRISWFGLLIILFTIFLISYYIRENIYNYLSPNKTISTKVLVVEGWMDDFALEEAYNIYATGDYEIIITTGGPLDIGYLATNFISTADLAKNILIKLGADSTKVFAVPRKHVLKKRTYQSALALKKFIDINYPNIKNFNLVSLGAHSKRTWFLFQKALPDKEIGIIALRDQRFDPEKWWETSKGSRTIITEAIGYFYVFFFM